MSMSPNVACKVAKVALRSGATAINRERIPLTIIAIIYRREPLMLYINALAKISLHNTAHAARVEIIIIKGTR